MSTEAGVLNSVVDSFDSMLILDFGSVCASFSFRSLRSLPIQSTCLFFRNRPSTRRIHWEAAGMRDWGCGG